MFLTLSPAVDCIMSSETECREIPEPPPPEKACPSEAVKIFPQPPNTVPEAPQLKYMKGNMFNDFYQQQRNLAYDYGRDVQVMRKHVEDMERVALQSGLVVPATLVTLSEQVYLYERSVLRQLEDPTMTYHVELVAERARIMMAIETNYLVLFRANLTKNSGRPQPME